MRTSVLALIGAVVLAGCLNGGGGTVSGPGTVHEAFPDAPLTIEKTMFAQDGDLAIVLGTNTRVQARTATLIWPANESYRTRDVMDTEWSSRFTRRATFDGGSNQMDERNYRLEVNYSVEGEPWKTAVANMSLPMKIRGDPPEPPESLRYE